MVNNVFHIDVSDAVKFANITSAAVHRCCVLC